MASKPRLVVLRSRSDFQRLFEAGARVRPAPWLLFNFLPNDLGHMRCGWTLPRKVGSAVIRNRLKRWCREYFRHLLKEGSALPVDVNLVFRKTDDDFFKKLDYERFTKTMDKGWQQIQQRL